MSQLPILVSAALLSKSPANVRKSTNPEADAQLRANIAERGVIQNLVGVPVSRKKGHYRITAGGRRLDAVQSLIADGTFPADYALPVLVLKNARDAVEVSLSENFFRLAMNPAEACRAFRDVIEVEGKTPADVAKRFGVTERFVLGRLRLASLAQPVFDALEANEITLDVAKAYASTADTARQAAVFEMMGRGYDRDNTNAIRRNLASYSYPASDPKALLVGREAYVAAGGRIDSDLFSDASNERWIDTQIVDDLAARKLTKAAEELQAREGYAQIRIVTETQVPYNQTWSLQPLRGELPELSEEQEARQAEIEEELCQWEAAAEGGYEASDEDEAQIAALESELAGLTERTPILDDDQKTTALAYVVIGADGTPRIHEQLYVAPVETPEQDGQGEDDGDHGDDDSGDGEDTGTGGEEEDDERGPIFSQRLLERLAMMKTELLALHVASNPAFALDLGTFIMIDGQCRLHSYNTPSELKAPQPTRLIHDFVSEMPAAIEWDKLEAGLDRSWVGHDTLSARYDAFLALPDEVRAAWLGWVVARTLRAVPHGGPGADFLDHLGTQLGIDVAAWWRPTAIGYFDRITKPAILDLFGEIGGAELKSRYAGSKKHDLAAAAEKLFAGDVLIEAETKERALAWLPEPMRFDHGVSEAVDKVMDEALDEAVEAIAMPMTDNDALNSDADRTGEDDAPLADAA